MRETVDIQTLFSEAILKSSPEECQKFLDSACGGDAQLRSEVLALIDSHYNAGKFLGGITHGASQPTVVHPVNERPGTTIGRYTLHDQIGEGGFGVVYRAEQTKPVKREVALKIIKPGMDTKEVINRFAAEQQALALMNHPHIARVIDAGATDAGRPYFVMDLVEGVPITDYCDQHQLAIDSRLRLFLQVCDAVQHAHQKGIIHRDLKPTNILVTTHDNKPVPKVIDFGVAKAISQRLTEQTIYTSALQMIGTPMYMSPEQAEPGAIDVDTRSDVYSLGVLLYELLTGTTPFDRDRFKSATYDEIRRVIREEDPPRPSARISTLGAKATTAAEHRKNDPRRLIVGLRNELDWIVMKALEKDRERRYKTVADFAEDLELYLTGEPVAARPPSTSYRLKKCASRNRAALITAAVIVVTLVAGTGISIWQAVEAKRQREVAESERIEANRHRLRAEKSLRETLLLVDRMMGRLFEDTDLPDAAHASRMDAWNCAVQFYQRFITSGSEPDRQRLLEIGIASVHLSQLFAKVGDDQSVERALTHAVSIFQRLVHEIPTDNMAWLELAEARAIRARHLLVRSQQRDAALSEYRRAFDSYAEALRISPDDARTLYVVSRSLMSCPFSELQDKQRALELAEHAMTVGVQKLDNTTFKAANCFALLALTEFKDRAAYRRACENSLAMAVDRDNADDLNTAAWTCVLAPEAVGHPADVVQLAETACRIEPQRDWYLGTLAWALYRAGRYREAAQRFTDLISRRKNRSWATSYCGLAMTRQQLGHAADARRWLTEAVDKANRERADNPSWGEQMTLDLFQREAEALIGPPYPKSPALPETPADSQESRTRIKTNEMEHPRASRQIRMNH